MRSSWHGGARAVGLGVAGRGMVYNEASEPGAARPGTAWWSMARQGLIGVDQASGLGSEGLGQAGRGWIGRGSAWYPPARYGEAGWGLAGLGLQVWIKLLGEVRHALVRRGEVRQREAWQGFDGVDRASRRGEARLG